MWFKKKVKPLYNNLKQKEGKRSKTGELNDKEGGLIILERGFALKKKKKKSTNRSSCFCKPRGRWIPRSHWGNHEGGKIPAWKDI